jgi:hypothetical protein
MQKSPRRALAIAIAGVLLGIAGCANQPAGSPPAATSSGQPTALATPGATASALWPAPPDPVGLARAAGLQPEPKEIFVNHVHAHLDVFVDGVPIVVPAGIGINIEDPGVRRFDEPDGSLSYGGITLCGAPCISPLHTHDASGVIHTESGTTEPNHLGQLFTEWGVTLSETCVAEFCSPTTPIAFYIDGEPFTGDPTAIELADLTEIAIVIGTPPAVIPSTADFSNA